MSPLLANQSAGGMPPSQLVIIVAIGLLLIFLAFAPGLIARRRGHRQWRAIMLCGVLGMLFSAGILWVVALVWAHMTADAAAAAPAVDESPGRFEIRGVDQSGRDRAVMIEAASPANARVKAEQQGITVTRLQRA